MAGLFLIIDVCILCITNQPTFLVCHWVVLYTAGTIRLGSVIMFKTSLNNLEYPTMNIFEIFKRLYKTFLFLLFLLFYCRVVHLKCLIGIDTNVWKGKKCFICRKSGKQSLFGYKYLSNLLEPSNTVCAVRIKRGPISLWYVVWMFHKHVRLAECFLRNSLEHVCIHMECVPSMTKSV